jgi:hypothetical protein
MIGYNHAAIEGIWNEMREVSSDSDEEAISST